MRLSTTAIVLSVLGAAQADVYRKCEPGFEHVKIDFEYFNKGEYVYDLDGGVKVIAAGVPHGRSYTPNGVPIGVYSRKPDLDWCGRHQQVGKFPFFGKYIPYGCPRIFDSSHPTGKDYDLGTPNEDFYIPGTYKYGPGVGHGGKKGKPGQNKEPKGNVLIIQEKDKAAPDDSRDGGAFLFLFPGKTYVKSIGLLDMDSWFAVLGLTYRKKRILYRPVKGLGDNSVQEFTPFPFTRPPRRYRRTRRQFLRKLAVVTKDSGAITHLDLCIEKRRHRALRAEEGGERDLQEDDEYDFEIDGDMLDMGNKMITEDMGDMEEMPEGWEDWEDTE